MLRSIAKVFLGVILGAAVVGTAWSQATYPTAVVTISGSQSAIPVTGTLTIAFNGHSHTVSYGALSTPSSIAAGFASAFSSYPASAWPRLCTNGVCAKAYGPTIRFQVSRGAVFQPIIITANPATSGPFTATATTAETVSLVSTANPAVVGSSVTFTASVPRDATGTVAFLDGSSILGNVTVANGLASFTTSSLTGGNHVIATVYSGDSSYSGSTSGMVNELVSQLIPVVTLATSSTPSNHGASVSFTATFSNLSASSPTGSVTFSDAGKVLGTLPISGSTATITISTLASGTHLISAFWPGDVNYAPATSRSITQVVAGILLLGPGIINTITGNGTQGYSGDGGVATAAALEAPGNLSIDGANNLYFCDGFSRVRKVSATTGIITTVAGNGTVGYSGDSGAATSAEMSCGAMGVDNAGDIFIADWAHNRVREVFASSGIIITVAGDGTAGYSGDGGQATSAQIDLAPVASSSSSQTTPTAFAVDGAGNLYFFNAYEHGEPYYYDIRFVSAASGIISTFANGNYSSSTISDAGFGFIVDRSGNLYVQYSSGTYKIPTSNPQAYPPSKVTSASGALTTVDSSGNLYLLSDNGLTEVSSATGAFTPIVSPGGPGEGCQQQTNSIGDGCLAIDTPSPYGLSSALVIDTSGDIFTVEGLYIRGIGALPATQIQASTIVLSCTSVTYGEDTVCNASVTAGATGTISFAYPGTSGVSIAYTSPQSVAGGAISVLLPTSKLTVSGYSIAATYNGDGTFVPSVATATMNVSQATPLVTWPAPAPIQYGTPLTALELNASTPVPGTFAYIPGAGTILPVGSNTLGVRFVPTDTLDYTNVVSVSRSLQVADAIPTVSWSAPSPIQSGTALSSIQLNATANVPGTFAYNPSAGTVLAVGAQQLLTVTFTPTSSSSNSSNSPITQTVQIDVIANSPVITGILQNPAAVAQQITIVGQNFGPAQGLSTVIFNGVSATALIWGDTSIIVQVPPGATTGNVVVSVGTPSNGFLLIITGSCP